MPAPPEILKLIHRFSDNEAAYRAGKNETEIRVEFVDPFFQCLGWDIYNKLGFAEAYKDVIHEDQIKVGGATKAPDYCFRIGGTRKFFLEAKRPSVNVKSDPDPAFQLRRYAWSAKLPLSILTNFAEFAVYDCRVKPDQNDKASAAHINQKTIPFSSQRGTNIQDTSPYERICRWPPRMPTRYCVIFGDLSPLKLSLFRIAPYC
jgi:predicted type IV restriction endonuclease